jgi:hypothetical protein
VHPRALVTAVGDQAYPDLHDCQRQAVVDDAGSVAGLDRTVEEQPSVHLGHILGVCLAHAGVLGRPWPPAEPREHHFTDPLPQLALLLDRLLDLPLHTGVQLEEVLAQFPGVDVKRLGERLAKRFLELVVVDGRWLIIGSHARHADILFLRHDALRPSFWTACLVAFAP